MCSTMASPNIYLLSSDVIFLVLTTDSPILDETQRCSTTREVTDNVFETRASLKRISSFKTVYNIVFSQRETDGTVCYHPFK